VKSVAAVCLVCDLRVPFDAAVAAVVVALADPPVQRPVYIGHAYTVYLSHAYTVYIGHAYTVYIGHAYTVYLSHAYTVYISHAYTVYIGHAYTVYIGHAYTVYIGHACTIVSTLTKASALAYIHMLTRIYQTSSLLCSGLHKSGLCNG